MANPIGNKFGWHSGKLYAKDAYIKGDLYIQDDIVFSDVSAGRLSVTGGLNFDSVSLSSALFSAGSYSSPMDQATTTGFGTFASTSDDDAFRIGLGIYMKGTGSGTKIFPLSVQAEYNGTAGVDRIQAAQFITYFGAGGEAARLLTLGGDAVAGAYAVWAKITSSVSSTFDSGSRVAAIWVDNQVNGTVSGEHYSFFVTTGSNVDAVFGFETGAKWSSLFYFDETCATSEPVVAGDKTGGSKDYYLKVNLNGTIYAIQLYAV